MTNKKTICFLEQHSEIIFSCPKMSVALEDGQQLQNLIIIKIEKLSNLYQLRNDCLEYIIKGR